MEPLQSFDVARPLSGTGARNPLAFAGPKEDRATQRHFALPFCVACNLPFSVNGDLLDLPRGQPGSGPRVRLHRRIVHVSFDMPDRVGPKTTPLQNVQCAIPCSDISRIHLRGTCDPLVDDVHVPILAALCQSFVARPHCRRFCDSLLHCGIRILLGTFRVSRCRCSFSPRVCVYHGRDIFSSFGDGKSMDRRRPDSCVVYPRRYLWHLDSHLHFSPPMSDTPAWIPLFRQALCVEAAENIGRLFGDTDLTSGEDRDALAI